MAADHWYTGGGSAYYGTLVGARSFNHVMDNVFGAVHDGLVSMGQASFNWSINGNGSGGMSVTTRGGSFEVGGRAWGSLWRGMVRNHAANGLPTKFQLRLGAN